MNTINIILTILLIVSTIGLVLSIKETVKNYLKQLRNETNNNNHDIIAGSNELWTE